jgi:hypothetical protein
MAKIKIVVHEDGKPSATITVPLWLAKSASGLISKAAGSELRNRIDIDQIIRAAESPGATGVILDIEDHEDNDRITISIIAD